MTTTLDRIAPTSLESQRALKARLISKRPASYPTPPHASRRFITEEIFRESDRDDYLARLSEAVGSAIGHRKHSLKFALMAGQLLWEWRQQLSFCACKNNGIDAQPDPTAQEWLASQGFNVPAWTISRWKSFASRAMAFLLNEVGGTESGRVTMELDGELFRISDVLTRPESDCTPAMLKFRASLDALLSDATLVQASEVLLGGQSDGRRLTLAANGKKHGGYRGENRRNYSLYVAVRMNGMAQNVERWEKFVIKNPFEADNMREAMRTVIMGGRFLAQCNFPKDGAKADTFLVESKGWPKGFRKMMLSVLKESFRETPEENAPINSDQL